MAPEPRNVSAKGKARVYLCLTCGTRHSPPTSCMLRPGSPIATHCRCLRRGPTFLFRYSRCLRRGPPPLLLTGRPRKVVPLPVFTSDSEDESEFQLMLAQSRA